MSDSRDIEKEVLIDIDDAIHGDIDTFNECLCELTGEPLLQDIQWSVVGARDGGVLLRVTGYVEEEA